MAKKKKTFSERTLQDVIAGTRASGGNVRTAVIALFEIMETKAETEQGKVKPKAKVAPPVKRRSLPKAKAEPKAASKPKSKPKSAG